MRKGIAGLGCQNGDEGKGKEADVIIDLAAKRSVFEVGKKPILTERFMGGPGAGHTFVIQGQKYKLNLSPAGVFTPQAYNLCGKRTFTNPRVHMQEILELKEKGIKITPDNYGIDSKAHVVFDFHVDEDQANLNKPVHSSTGSGIKQVAIDKYARVGTRFVEFLDEKVMFECLKRRFKGDNTKTKDILKQIIDSYAAEREFLSQFLVQEHQIRQKYGLDFWVGEGAQGFLLDIDDGQYPGITSSHVTAIPPQADYILGVVKLYLSSVGILDRPFVSKMPAKLEDRLREEWGEFGTKTGKKRNLGWFDAIAGRYAVESMNVDALAGNCGDRMESFYRLNEKIKLVTAYKINEIVYDRWDILFDRRDTLREAEPVFEEFEPWEHFTEKDGETLSPRAQRYVDRIQELLDREFIIYGKGPAREETIVLKDPWDLIEK